MSVERSKTMLDIIRRVIEYEVNRRQEVYEMLTDGYAGDIEAYLTDYAGDYDVEEVTTDTYKVCNLTGQSWIVEDGKVGRLVF